MENVVGIFSDRKNAETAMEQLRIAGFEPKNLVLLTSERADDKLRRIPSEDAEQPGMGKAIGSVAGGAAGLAAGTVISSLLLSGVGSILAVGLGASAFGLGGAVAGAAAGDFVETALSHGLPKDEIFFYEDALRQGRSVIIASARKEELIERARIIMERERAESLDAARNNWWIGLRDAEQAHYLGENSSGDAEQTYRRGFQAALEPRCRGKSFDEARGLLRERYSSACDKESFRQGYERGQRYHAEVNRHETRESP